MPAPQLRNSTAADRRQPTDPRAVARARNELARLAWERGPVEEDEDTREPGKAMPGWMDADRGDK